MIKQQIAKSKFAFQNSLHTKTLSQVKTIKSDRCSKTYIFKHHRRISPFNSALVKKVSLSLQCLCKNITKTKTQKNCWSPKPIIQTTKHIKSPSKMVQPFCTQHTTALAKFWRHFPNSKHQLPQVKFWRHFPNITDPQSWQNFWKYFMNNINSLQQLPWQHLGGVSLASAQCWSSVTQWHPCSNTTLKKRGGRSSRESSMRGRAVPCDTKTQHWQTKAHPIASRQ